MWIFVNQIFYNFLYFFNVIISLIFQSCIRLFVDDASDSASFCNEFENITIHLRRCLQNKYLTASTATHGASQAELTVWEPINKKPFTQQDVRGIPNLFQNHKIKIENLKSDLVC